MGIWLKVIQGIILMFMLLMSLTLVLPHSYEVERHIQVNMTSGELSPLEIKHWPTLFNWREHEVLWVTHQDHHSVIGSSGYIRHLWGKSEFTIIDITPSEIHLKLYIASEHSAHTTIRVQHNQDSKTVNINIKGTVHSPFLGGLTAAFMRFYSAQVLETALNHLRSTYKLRESHGNQT